MNGELRADHPARFDVALHDRAELVEPRRIETGALGSRGFETARSSRLEERERESGQEEHVDAELGRESHASRPGYRI